jgi:hypothetical protein
MSGRISVVVSQFERRHGQKAEFEEELVTQLLFTNGLDATLIADLKTIEQHSTDHLCLEGIKGDFVLASWESAEYVQHQLDRLGITGFSIVPMSGQPAIASASGANGKRIFFIALNQADRIDVTIQSIRKLVESRSVPVFNFGSIAKKPAASSLEITEIKPKIAPSLTMSTSQERIDSSPAIVSMSAANSHDEDDFPDLDRLLEDFDEFKL